MDFQNIVSSKLNNDFLINQSLFKVVIGSHTDCILQQLVFIPGVSEHVCVCSSSWFFIVFVFVCVSVFFTSTNEQ